MLGTFFLVLGGFAWLIAHSYRTARARERRGESFRPEGKVRW